MHATHYTQIKSLTLLCQFSRAGESGEKDGLPEALGHGHCRVGDICLAGGRGKRLAGSSLENVVLTRDLHQVDLRVVPMLPLSLDGQEGVGETRVKKDFSLFTLYFYNTSLSHTQSPPPHM